MVGGRGAWGRRGVQDNEVVMGKERREGWVHDGVDDGVCVGRFHRW